MGDRYRIDGPLSQWPRKVLAMLILVSCASFLGVAYIPDKDVLVPGSGSMLQSSDGLFHRGIPVKSRPWTASITII
jgi:hypothetical protein